MLAHMIQPPFTRGYVLGEIVGDPEVQHVQTGQADFPVNDYPFRVSRVIGERQAATYTSGVPQYRPGELISLRVPTRDNGRLSEGNIPVVPRRGVLVVLIRDHGQEWGGNTPDRIVASLFGQDLLDVKGSVVQGQGPWSDYAEALSAFEARVSEGAPSKG